jgi:hypothetical protein
MPNSGTVTAGSVALASQYNNLRADVLDASTSHTHSGAADAGAQIEGTALKSTGATAGHVLTAGAGGTTTTWSPLASSGALSLATASAAYATAASGTAVTYTGGGAGASSIGITAGGTVFLSISNNNNYSASARTYRTWNLGTGGASYIATSSVSPAISGTSISDIIGGAGFEAGTTFAVKENYGSGGTFTTYLRKFTTALTNSWNTTMATFSLTGNMGENQGPFGSSPGEAAIKWAQGPGIWYGGDHRTTSMATATTGGAGTVSIWVVNDVSGSAYSAPFGTASSTLAAFTYATVFVPSVGTATSGTIHAWGRVQSATGGAEQRYCTYAVGSASITAVSTAVSDLFIGSGSEHYASAARWDEARSQILLVCRSREARFIVGLDRTGSTVLFTSDENAQVRDGIWRSKSMNMLTPSQEGAFEQQHDLTTGFFASSSGGKVTVSRWGTPGHAMTPISPMWGATATNVFSPACVAGGGSATDVVWSGTSGDIRSRSLTAGLAVVSAAGTSSSAFRQITTTLIKPLVSNASIKNINAPGGYEIFAMGMGTGNSSSNLSENSFDGGFNMISYTHMVPGTSTLTVTVLNPYGTGAYFFTEGGTATFQTAGGTAFILTRTITMA